MKHIPIIYEGEHTPVLTTNMGAVAEYGSSEKNNDVLKKRMELFHYEYQSEQQEYAKRKEMEENVKLNAMLKHTRDTFNRLDFEEAEVFQITQTHIISVVMQLLLSCSIHSMNGLPIQRLKLSRKLCVLLMDDIRLK